MNLKELIEEYRRKADDETGPHYLWSDEELTGYANAAEREAARRALLLMDVESSVVCQYNITAGNPLILLDPRVVRVRRIRLQSQNAPLALRGWREIEELNEAWDTATGAPAVAVPDWQSDALRLVPIPVADDVAKAAVFRLPLKDMIRLEDSPEINVRYHLALVSGMLAQGYSKNDADTFNPEASAFHASQFDAVFGPPTVAINEINANRATGRERYGDAQ